MTRPSLSTPSLSTLSAVAARHTWTIVIGVGVIAGFLAGCVDPTGR